MPACREEEKPEETFITRFPSQLKKQPPPKLTNLLSDKFPSIVSDYTDSDLGRIRDKSCSSALISIADSEQDTCKIGNLVCATKCLNLLI